MSSTASMASLWALLYATAILSSEDDASTDNSGSSSDSKSDAEAGWIITSTLTLALAGFMLILTFWLTEHIIYKIAKPVRERVFAKKPKMVLFVTAASLLSSASSTASWPSSGMVVARREIRARRRIREIDLQLGELESATGSREGVAR
ncbi:hypothetical protein LTR27_010204 [Elasticomyces elasticus]|nr:hypothetical protein LTR27_010204 [Elasticomyces elasticus]